MPKITPSLWFDNNAEEALNFYTTVFPNAKILGTQRFSSEGVTNPDVPDQVLTGSFEIDGQEFMVINGGPQFKFTEAVSFVIECKDQDEIDYYWEKLGQGGTYQECGWLKDKFGLSWQIVPQELGQLVSNSDPEKSQKVMSALWSMQKLDIQALKDAAK